jgi:pSer/pThr/pTyr-binding forkhead associated (FHA) protein
MRIGRAPPADESFLQSVQALGLDNISRSHADLRLDASSGFVTLVDLGSRNGTFVDGVRVPANTDVSLRSGAVVRFAANLTLKILFIDNS